MIGEVLHILMEYCDGGDLSQRISSHKEQELRFEEAQILSWTSQIGMALEVRDQQILFVYH